MSKAIELALKHKLRFDEDADVEDFYAAAEAAGEKKLLDRLTAGVEVSESIKQWDEELKRWWPTGEFSRTQLLEHGAAQRLHEREECAKLCDSEPERQDGTGVWKVDHHSCAAAIRNRGEA